MRYTRLTWILYTCCWLTHSTQLTSAAEKPDAVLAKILSDWKARQQIADSMRYEIEGHYVVPRDSYPRLDITPGPLPVKDAEFDVSIELLLDFHNQGSRRIEEGEVLCGPIQSFIPRYEVCLYDGREYSQYKPRDRNTSNRWTPDKYDTELYKVGKFPYVQFFRTVDLPVFFSHGSFLSPQFEPAGHKMLNLPEAAIFAEHETIEYEGRQCILLRTHPLFGRGRFHHEIYVDPARDSAVVRYDFFLEKRLFSSLKIEHEATEHGWLPARWTVTIFENPNVAIIRKLHVKHREFNPQIQEQDLKIELTPGMMIYDRPTKSRLVSAGPGKPMIPLKEWQQKHPDN